MSDEPQDAGWFDLHSEVYVHPRLHNSSRSTAATAVHEGAHRNLAFTTTVGTALRYLQSLSELSLSDGRTETLQRVTDTLFDGTFAVQEGWASYVERLYHEFKGTAPERISPLPTNYVVALNRYLEAGQRLPEWSRWAEPLFLAALASGAMNTRILQHKPSSAWLQTVDSDLEDQLHLPDYRLQRICEGIAVGGWPETFLRESISLIRSQLKISPSAGRAEVVAALGSIEHGEVINAVQQKIDSAFVGTIGTIAVELADYTEPIPRDRVEAWWTAAQKSLAEIGADTRHLERGNHYDWLDHLAASNVSYLPERMVDDYIVNAGTAQVLWTNAPETVHVHLHIGPTFASFLLYDVPPDESSSEPASPFFRQRAVMRSIKEARAILDSGTIQRRSFSCTSAILADATARQALARIVSPPDWVLVEEDFDPHITMSLVQHYVASSKRLILGRTDNPDIGWIFADMGPVPGTSSSTFTMCCRAFPGFFQALERFEPALLDALWAKSTPLQQESREHEIPAKIVELYSIGGALPPL